MKHDSLSLSHGAENTRLQVQKNASLDFGPNQRPTGLHDLSSSPTVTGEHKALMDFCARHRGLSSN